jgi:hypothetical protein
VSLIPIRDLIVGLEIGYLVDRLYVNQLPLAAARATFCERVSSHFRAYLEQLWAKLDYAPSNETRRTGSGRTLFVPGFIDTAVASLEGRSCCENRFHFFGRYPMLGDVFDPV